MCDQMDKWTKVMIRQSARPPVESRYLWPPETHINGNDSSPYRTKAFVEVCTQDPDNPELNSFFRCNAKSLREAEDKAVMLYGKYETCLENGTHTEFERRDYTNGVGFCKSCGMFRSKAFHPLTTCAVCDKFTDHAQDDSRRWLCEKCCKTDESYQKSHVKRLKDLLDEGRPLSYEEIAESLTGVLENLSKGIKNV